MSEAERNKIAAQIIKAEMLGDLERVSNLKNQLDALANNNKPPHVRQTSRVPEHKQERKSTYSRERQTNLDRAPVWQDNRVRKFLSTTGSLGQMFEAEKKVTASQEARMFIKTAARFSRDDMETKYFSEEIDNSQVILNKNKRHKPGTSQGSSGLEQPTSSDAPCHWCSDRIPKHLIIDSTRGTYMSATATKPFLSHMSNVIIRNKEHTCNSFVGADHKQQTDVEHMIESLRVAWKAKGYRCIIIETYFRDRRPAREEFTSCGNHFQVHCLPIKEKHFERSRMSFKQALQDCEQEWSMNRKLIVTEGRRIQRHLPKGLSYFWVCFDELTNGFGHVIEQENNFSRFFGLEVLSSLLDKDFNPMRLNQREDFDEQFKRCRDFKLMYSEHRLDGG